MPVSPNCLSLTSSLHLPYASHYVSNHMEFLDILRTGHAILCFHGYLRCCTHFWSSFSSNIDKLILQHPEVFICRLLCGTGLDFSDSFTDFTVLSWSAIMILMLSSPTRPSTYHLQHIKHSTQQILINNCMNDSICRVTATVYVLNSHYLCNTLRRACNACFQ